MPAFSRVSSSVRTLSPVEKEAGSLHVELGGQFHREIKLLKEQQLRIAVSQELSVDLKVVPPFDEVEPVSIAWNDKMMIRRDSRFAYEQPTSPGQLLVAMGPKAEVLFRFPPRRNDTYILSTTRPLLDVA